MPDPQLRAADSDREAVAAALGRALSEGRLTVDEYEERLATALAARTYGDLAGLTADLPGAGTVRPAPAPAASGSPRPAAGASGRAPWLRTGMRAVWAPWLTTALIVTVIWLATSIGHGRFEYFWPIWVIGPWGAVLLARTITGGPARHHHHDRHDRRRRGLDRSGW